MELSAGQKKHNAEGFVLKGLAPWTYEGVWKGGKVGLWGLQVEQGFTELLRFFRR